MTVRYYQNRENPNKLLEIHDDGYGHYGVRQFIRWEENYKNKRIKRFNPTGDGKFHRWKKKDLSILLRDYEITEI